MVEAGDLTIDAVLGLALGPVLGAVPIPCGPILALVLDALDPAFLEATDQFPAVAVVVAAHLDVDVRLQTLDPDLPPETRPSETALDRQSEAHQREASRARPVEAPEIEIVPDPVPLAADPPTQSDADTLSPEAAAAAEAAPEAAQTAEDVTLDRCPCHPAAAAELAVPSEGLAETALASRLKLNAVGAEVEAEAEAILAASVLRARTLVGAATVLAVVAAALGEVPEDGPAVVTVREVDAVRVPEDVPGASAVLMAG